MTGMIQVFMSGGGSSSAIIITGPSSASGTRSTSGLCVSSLADMTVTGGSGSYTYSWGLVSGGTGISVSSSTAQDTTFSGTVGPGTPTLSGVYALTVTDTITSATATSSNVSVTLSYTP
jgi:hypothetical protein